MPDDPEIWLDDQSVAINTGVGDTDAIQLANGYTLVSWTDPNTASLDIHVFGRFYDPLGNPASDVVRIVTPFFFGAVDETKARLAPLPNGDFIVVYEDRGAGGIGEDLVYEIMSFDPATGTVSFVDSGFIIDDGAGTDRIYSDPQIAVASATSAAFVWLEVNGTPATGSSVHFKPFNPSTGVSGSTVFVSANDTFPTLPPAVTVLANGNFAVVVGLRAPNGVEHVSVSVFSPSGAFIGADGFTPSASQGLLGVDITPLNDGGFAVAYGADSTSMGSYRHELRFYDGIANQTGASGSFGTNAIVDRPRLATLADDTVIFTSSSSSTSSGTVQRFDTDGTFLGIGGTGAGGSPTAVALADGRFALVGDRGDEIRVEFLDTRDTANAPVTYDGEDWQIGTIGNDVFVAAASSESVFGWEGNDNITVPSFRASQHIDAGAGTLDLFLPLDIMTGDIVNLDAGTFTRGAATMEISNFERVIVDSEFGIMIFGNDDIGGDVLLGIGTGNHTIFGGGGNDVLRGGDGANDLSGQSGDDALAGLGGNDSLRGGIGNDELFGGDDDDTLVGGPGEDSLDGNDGIDTLDYSGSTGGVHADLAQNNASGGEAEGDTIAGFENAIGGSGDDSLFSSNAAAFFNGAAGDDELFGGGGDDTFEGGSGNDRLSGQLGNNSLNGGAGDDTLIGRTGDDTLNGGSGDDVVSALGGFDIFDGGPGSDTLDYSFESATLTVNLATNSAVGGSATGDVFSNFENVFGGSGADTLTGDDGNNLLDGGNEDDLLNGGLGDDTLIGSAGEDTLNGGVGNDLAEGSVREDTISGGSGNDTLQGNNGSDLIDGGSGADRALGGPGDDTVSGEAGNDRLFGNSGLDTIEGGSGSDSVLGGALSDSIKGDGGSDDLRGNAGDDTIEGGTGGDLILGQANDDLLHGDENNDTISGNGARDTVHGGDGADLLRGNAGNDVIYGEAGADQILGGNGRDVIYGGIGEDRLGGGSGADKFVFREGESGASIASADLITDFSQSEGDTIKLNPIDAIAGGGDDAFTFIGTAAFSGTAGELRYETSGGETHVFGDTDGDGSADFALRLLDNISLTASDFVL